MNTLVIPRILFSELRAHGERTYPHECCGALLGRATPQGWEIVSLAHAANVRLDSAHCSYEIAPAELVEIARLARSRDLEIAGFYHSHPDHPAQWSPTDLAEAHWLGCSYVITEVDHGKAAITNSFLLAGTAKDDKHFEPQEMQIGDSSTHQAPV